MPSATNDLLETNILGPETRQWGVAQGACPALNSRGIRSLGVANVGFGYKIVRLRPTFSLINICLEGTGHYLIGDEWVKLEEGTAIIRPALVPHGSWQFNHGRWRMAWVVFDERRDSVARPTETFNPRVKTDPVLWECALNGLRRELETSNDEQHLLAWVQTIFLLCQRVLKGRIDRLSPLWQLVEARLSEPWTVAELAARAGMSEVHLRRLTQAAWHRSPMQHLSWLRVRRAEYLLSLPGQTVEDVAAEVGYESPSSFTTAFKRWLGCSPRGTVVRDRGSSILRTDDFR